MTRIAIWRGTFDLFHKGHELKIKYALDVADIEEIHLLANGTNPYKENVLDYSKRREMLMLIAEDYPQVRIIDEPDVRHYIQLLRETDPAISVIGMMGSDGALVSREEQNLEVDEWLVFRSVEDQLAALHKTINNKKVTIIEDEAYQGHFVSSKIKALLVDSQDMNQILTESVPEKIKAYILKNRPYPNPSLSELELPRINIIVGTKNKIKISAINSSVEKKHSQCTFAPFSFDVASGVRSQPIGIEETKAGAKNRMSACIPSIFPLEMTYVVGVENGLVKGEELASIFPDDAEFFSKDHWYDLAIVAVTVIKKGSSFTYVSYVC